METASVPVLVARPVQVCFFFNAQRHQILHGISTAVALSRRPGFHVAVVSPARGHVDYARNLAERLGGGHISFVHARSRLLGGAMRRTGKAVPPKLLSLSVLARWLNGFDAIALPERTSMLLKRVGVRRPKFIHLDHGAGDRAAGFDRRIRLFDFVLMAGPKHRERLMRERLIRPGSHAVVGYPKFEAADAARDAGWRPFPDERPVVLYNPHFCALGSWAACAEPVLAAFAAQDRYNLIVAPHVRLLDGHAARERWGALLVRYAGHPRIHVDQGSDRAIDMTHTMLAAIYLGDVSSQVYEFLREPRPCLFLNPHGVAWEADENYGHWRFGEVLPDATGVIAAVDRAIESHPRYRPAQRDGIAETFLAGGGGETAAAAIATYLRAALPASVPQPVMAAPARRGPAHAAGFLRRAAMLLPVLVAGGLMHGAIEPGAIHAATSPFVDRAVASHRTTLMRLAMVSQPEATVYDPGEIRQATGIILPLLPPGWRVGDVQIYPSTYGHIVQLLLRAPDRARLSLVAMRMETDAEARPLFERRARERIAYWEAGDFAYALVGRLSPSHLRTLSAQFAGRGGATLPTLAMRRRAVE